MPSDLDSFIAEFHAYLLRRVNPATARGYESDLNLFTRWFERVTGESFHPAALVHRDLLDWREEMSKTTRPASLNRRMSALRAFFDWAQQKGLVSLDPTRRLRSARVEVPSRVAPSPQVMERLLQQVRLDGNLRDRALLELLAGTGLRLQEAANLRIQDLDLGPASAWVTMWGHDSKTNRRVALDVRVRLALQEYLNIRLPKQPEEYVFLSRQGKPITPFIIWYTVKKYARQIGQDSLTPREFRRAVALMLARDPNIGIHQAAARMGHRHAESFVRYLPGGDQK